LAFEPGTHGEPMEEAGYFAGCDTGEGGSACEIHARGAVFMAYSEGPSEPEALNALADLWPGDPVKFTGDAISMGDVTVDFALNTVVENPGDPLASVVSDLQGTWRKDRQIIRINGLEWTEEGAAPTLISLGSACADGVDRGTLHLSLYEMGGDPFAPICIELVARDSEQLDFRDVATGDAVVLTR